MLQKKMKYIIVAALLLALPLVFIGNSYFLLLLCTGMIYVIAVSGLDLLFGYSGQISLGHAGFFAIGAYTSAILSIKLGIPVVFSMLFAAGLATMFAVLIALPAARLVHHFLALITISFGEIVYLFVAHADPLTNGFSGIGFIPSPSLGFLVFDTNMKYYYFLLVIVAVLLLFKNRIIRSRTGRAIIAVRENIYASDGIGINVKNYKILSFALSAFYTGLAGALYAHLIGFISPESFTLNQSIIFLTMLLLGGMGNFYGPIIGALVLTLGTEYLQVLGNYQMLVYGSLLLLIVVFIPSGLINVVNLRDLKKILHKRTTVKENDANA